MSEAVNKTKRCPTCEETKDVSMFTANRGKADGCGSYCKECDRKRKKSSYVPSPRRIISAEEKRNRDRKRLAKWRKENRAHARKLIAGWRTRHPEEALAQRKRRNQSIKNRLTASYVGTCLRMPVPELHANPGLLELKRAHLKITRKLREQNK